MKMAQNECLKLIKLFVIRNPTIIEIISLLVTLQHARKESSSCYCH